MVAACELGIFEVLSRGRSTVKELCAKLCTNQIATTQLLDALVWLDLLEKHCKEEPPCYSNMQIAERFLVKTTDGNRPICPPVTLNDLKAS